ncbi:CD209 antigen-like protein C [Triplophysa rosa]|uniref:CD209 antigen-like protein C n=1 Tax=Triplophysa rosa TaxID=992332 RepID=UPI002545F334|nr:CD209 antigen-like protein C [Triplophysa rosa]
MRGHRAACEDRNRSPRSVLVCLVVLCVLLLTAVIVLCVLIYTNNHQFHINYKNITQDRDQLLTKKTKLTEEKNQLLTAKINLTKERDGLLTQNNNLTKQRDQLKKERNAHPKNCHGTDIWLFHESSFYFISSEKKSWSESRSYCRERGTNLVIINNRKEQDFVKKISGTERLWIGLSDSDEEGRWKWVDGSTLTYSFWKSEEPNRNAGDENCAVSDSSGWDDYVCTNAFKFMCEKKIR